VLSTLCVRCLTGALLLVAALPAAALAKPRPGSFDRSFGGDGRVVLNLPGERMVPSAMAVQPDGKIVVVGTVVEPGAPDYVVTGRALAVRFLRDGQLDSSFGAGGIARHKLALPVSVGGVAIQPDGRILLAGQAMRDTGSAPAAVIRLLPDGSLDEGFGSGGMALIDPEARGAYLPTARFVRVALQPDGRIVAAGQTDSGDPHDPTNLIVARLLPDGQLDPSFNGDGSWDSYWDYVVDIVSHPDGHMIVVGWNAMYFGGSSVFAVRFSTGPAALPTPVQEGPDLVQYDFKRSLIVRAAGLRADGSVVIAGELWDTANSKDLAWVRLSPDLKLLDRRVADSISVEAVAFDSREALLTVGPPARWFHAPPFGVRRYRGPELRRDHSLGRRRGSSPPVLKDPGVVIGAAVDRDGLVIAGTTGRYQATEHPLTLVRLHAQQDGSGPIATVHGLPRRRCVEGLVRPLVRVRDESDVRVTVRVDRHVVSRSRHKRLRVDLDTSGLAPGRHKLVVSARDAAGNLGGSGSPFRVCGHG
jgi:uncharacterized delta-60 repeat protein